MKSTANRRLSAPTGTAVCGETSARQRRQETMIAACAIHGGTFENNAPATIGMLTTLEKQSKETDILGEIKRCKKIKERVLPKAYKMTL